MSTASSFNADYIPLWMTDDMGNDVGEQRGKCLPWSVKGYNMVPTMDHKMVDKMPDHCSVTRLHMLLHTYMLRLAVWLKLMLLVNRCMQSLIN